MRVVVITGISGSGKSVAINVLEDDGYYCIDNLPARFLHEVITSLQETGQDRIAVSIDARSGDVDELRGVLAGLGRFGQDVKLLFLNAATDALVHRYSETRRRHPMSIRRGDGAAELTLVEAIEREREAMAEIQDFGISIDTSDLHPNVLRQWIRDVVGSERAPLTILFESFAYKHGVPLNADLVFDVRCLPNPYWELSLRRLNGKDAPVKAFLDAAPAVQEMVDDIVEFLEKWIPRYQDSQRSYLTVAIGCTGGMHRSVYVAEAVAERLGGSTHSIRTHHNELR